MKQLICAAFGLISTTEYFTSLPLFPHSLPLLLFYFLLFSPPSLCCSSIVGALDSALPQATISKKQKQRQAQTQSQAQFTPCHRISATTTTTNKHRRCSSVCVCVIKILRHALCMQTMFMTRSNRLYDARPIEEQRRVRARAQPRVEWSREQSLVTAPRRTRSIAFKLAGR